MQMLKKLRLFTTVQLIDGAQFSSVDIPNEGKTGAILISQSGETKDLHRCIEIAKHHKLLTIGVINVVDSLIAREVDCGCYLHAGREVGVASTKAFTSQVVVLSLIVTWFAQHKQNTFVERAQMIQDLQILHKDVQKTIDNTIARISSILPLFETVS